LIFKIKTNMLKYRKLDTPTFDQDFQKQTQELNEQLENAQTTPLFELIFNSPNEETAEQRIPFTFEVGRTSFQPGSLVGLYSERDKIGFENLEEVMVNWKESQPQFPYQSMEYEPSNEKYSPSRTNTLDKK
jgi:putative NADH-flavin reductase